MQIILKNIDEEAIEKAVNEANLETLSCKFLPENNALVRAQLEIENEARKVFEEAYAVGSLVLPQAREEYVGLHSSESIERLPNEADKKKCSSNRNDDSIFSNIPGIVNLSKIIDEQDWNIQRDENICCR